MSEPSARRGLKPMHSGEVEVDDDLVRRLVTSQFPVWAPLSLRRAASTGTDNVIYRLGDHLGLRLPRIHWAVPQITKEHEWLPRLAAHLPASVPEPVALGAPGQGYQYPWLVYRWVNGADAMAGPVNDWGRLVGRHLSFRR